MKQPSFLLMLIACLFLYAGCAPLPEVVPMVTMSANPPTATITHTPVPPTATPEPAAPSPAPTLAPQICSPLDAVALEALPDMVSNPFRPPAPGSDDPHQGVDLALLLPGSQAAMPGHPVTAAYPGRVAGIIRDRFPYGNAVLVETPLDQFPTSWWEVAGLPEPAPTLVPSSALTCPSGVEPEIAEPGRRSLYVLYAHLREIADLRPGDPIGCGQPLGAVGDSGNALNPHLHFETRAGPSGLRLESMAHYDSSASPAEMSSYCLWRISGLFQLVDPLQALHLTP